MFLDAWALVVSMGILAVMLAVWLVAELRGSIRVRVVIGIANMVLLLLALWIVISSTERVISMHRLNFKLIDRLIEEGRATDVQRAARVYEETCRETHSAKSAVYLMYSVLSEPVQPSEESNAY